MAQIFIHKEDHMRAVTLSESRSSTEKLTFNYLKDSSWYKYGLKIFFS